MPANIHLCADKTRIISQLMKSDSFPEKKLAENFYKHELVLLRKLAALDDEMEKEAAVRRQWETEKDWSEQSRYEVGKTEQEATNLYDAIEKGGVAVDQGTLVEIPINDGRRFVERFAADGNRVEAAFWAKTAEDGLWFLYVATDLYDRDGPAAAYRTVGASLRKLGTVALSGSEIKVISPNNPIAKDVLKRMSRHPARLATGRTTLGSMEVEQTIIYPARSFTFTQANPMTTEEIGREILQLMNRDPGIIQPSRVALKDGTAFGGVPFALELGPQREVVVRFLADGELAPRVIRLDEIASIN